MPVTHVALIDGGRLEMIDADNSKMISDDDLNNLSDFISEVGGVCEKVYFSPSFLKPHRYGLGDFSESVTLFRKAKEMAEK